MTGAWDSAERAADRVARSALPARSRTPVLVCGAGPVGLVLALLLDRYGVPCTVVDRHEGTSVHPKARGISQRTMEVLDRVGCAEEALAISRRADEDGVHYAATLTRLAGELLTRFPVSPPPDAGGTGLSPWPNALVGQHELEALLVRRCRERGVDVRFGTRLRSLTRSGDEVVSILEDRATGDEGTVVSDYLVGCDGARSTVRAALDIALDGRHDIERHVNVLLDADLDPFVRDRRSVLYAVTRPRVPGIFLAVDNRRSWLFDFRVPEGPEDPDTWTDAALLHEVVRDAVGADVDVTVRSVVAWAPSAAVAGAYGRGRVLLAGDSAHVMPPTGAMGANTGIQDADNLAWKLADVLHGRGGPALLATYEQERRPVGRRTVAFADALLTSGAAGRAAAGGRGGP
ncbi:MAG: FAD-dependent monooxygenase, partial [Kineosporiaceae bacterium]